MSISKFSFQDEIEKWHLSKVAFSDFNLLVGKSGVGKTKIINAIKRVCQAATFEADQVVGCKWHLELKINSEKYLWEASVASGVVFRPDIYFANESLTIGEKEIINRDYEGKRFIFNGKTLPRLDNKQSVIKLLQYEPSIAPIYSTLSAFMFSEASKEEASFWLREENDESLTTLVSGIRTLSELRERDNLPILIKLWILQNQFSEEFQIIEEQFKEIFPTVSRVSIFSFKDRKDYSDDSIYSLSLQIEEKGVGRVAGVHISSGMAKTFFLLAEITLSPPETVILVDEIENSLGVNCLPQIMEHFLRRADLQFILTSHHPYIINNIPMKYWKLVTRKGSVVTVKDASSIRGLDPDSLLSGFVQLTNTEEYEEAIR